MKIVIILFFFLFSLMANAQSKYELKELNGKIVCTSFENIANLSEENIFVNALLWAIDKCSKFKESIVELNYDKKYFTIQSTVSSPKRSENQVTYRFYADFAVSVNKLSFTFSKIECEYPGMLNMSTVIAFERLKPDKKPKHKVYIEEYTKQATEYIEQILEYINNNECQPVNNWSEIKRGKVIKGMTETECLLAYGKPLEISKSENNEVRWRYDTYSYLFFKNGILTSILE